VQAEGTQACPNCGATLPVVQPYITWCDGCGWNIAAPVRPPPTGRFERLYEDAGRRSGERMERELARGDNLEPRLTLTKAFAYAIAAAVHVVTLALLVGGVVLVALFPTKIFAIVGAVLAISLALLVRPRLGKAPKENLVPRSEAPTLFRLVDRVAQAMGTKTADLLVVDEEYNASWGIYGLRRTRVLHLGLPLLSALEAQERVALIAHEIAHAKNGDASRGLFVGSACRGLAQWYLVLAPHRARSAYGGIADTRLAEHVANGLLWVLSRPPLWLFRLEVHLLLQDSRRAEYLADAIAAREAGSAAIVGVHEKLLLQGSFQQIVRRYAHPSTHPEDGDLFAAVLPTLAAVPERERERRRRVALLEASSLGSTHPPTGQRIRLLEQRPILAAQVVLSNADSDAIDRELSGLRPALQRKLVENQRSSLYRR
jgi:Zn-dependent protease with chaperone function